MTRELTAFFERSSAAERAGDAAEALAYHDGIPMFRRSRHRSLLEQLVAADGELTPWVWARWIVYQSIRCEEPGSRTGALQRIALADAVETLHIDLLEETYDAGGDPVPVTARVLGESWAFHQLAVHDYGVLSSFVDEFATGTLAEHAGLVHEWVGTPMGGYRIEGRGSPCTLRVRDLGTDERREVLDLGAGAGAAVCVIGRLVSTGGSPDLMFDTAPLVVDEATAREVARRVATPAGWVDALAEAIRERRLRSETLLREDYELMTDVPSLAMVEFGTRPTELARVMEQFRSGRDEVGRAAFRILRSASEGALEVDAAPYVGAAVLNVHAYGEAQRQILAPGQQPHWVSWAELVPEPARSRLLGFARATMDAA